ADAERPVAIAGVMGGEESEVGPETSELLLEAANFEPLGILRTSERLHLRSEASTRWEKGVDPYAAAQAATYATELLVELTGARWTGHADVYAPPPERLRALRGVHLLAPGGRSGPQRARPARAALGPPAGTADDAPPRAPRRRARERRRRERGRGALRGRPRLPPDRRAAAARALARRRDRRGRLLPRQGRARDAACRAARRAALRARAESVHADARLGERARRLGGAARPLAPRGRVGRLRARPRGPLRAAPGARRVRRRRHAPAGQAGRRARRA